MTQFRTNSDNSIWKGKNGPLLIAEIGGNHEGDFDKAKDYLNLAIESGADCVKFQLYSGDTLVNKNLSPNRNQHFKKFELTKNQHLELAEKCLAQGVHYNASVWDLGMLDWIDSYLSFYKIGSGDLTCWPLIEEFAKRGKPILLSTGLSSFNEVSETVKFIRSVNKNYKKEGGICLLQCTSMYPISRLDANLNVLKSFKLIPNIDVGYSDHTEGDEALHTAFILGASVLEFHFTDHRENKEFRDHKVSLTKDELKQLILKINNTKLLLGKVDKELLPIERENNHHISFRRGIYPKNKIKKGTIIKAEDLIYLRPLEGTDARQYKKVIGSIAQKDIEPLDKMELNINYTYK
tara:strand:- start:2582 stop:3631 length:1050 start_codon:yes stop_codon:yes gene_type:complete